MLNITDPNNFGRTLAGVSLIAAPVALAAGQVLRLTAFGGTTGEQELLAAIDASPGLWQLMTVIDMISVILLVPAVWGMVHLTRGRSPVLAHIGGALAMVGVLGAAGHNIFGNVLTGGMAAVRDSHPVMETLVVEMEQTPGFLFALLMFIAGFTLGNIVLAVALLRARVIGRLPAGAIILSMLVFSNAGSSLPLTLVASALLLVGMGATARSALSLSDPEWAGLTTGNHSPVPAPAGAVPLS
ncbi:hypothetical protein [Ornithinimicrobium cryptoxanthini]|uniref:DUF4386 family protein n=1 Tax=Ornithinimicrobium cryptoxanthini TaxID=2934161 RepID=A0ABY4YDE1_9MICO|nr:hypothetical protein [Ornithinimicrobium cryptoxanthini]USQ74771.1 hypothetical protein NF557_08785 [Ornithinimicrobium cryptoxanthini]